MSHLLICGAAGYTNLGDDAILWGMLTQLHPEVGQRRIKVAGGPELRRLVEPFGATAISYDDRSELARAIEEAGLVVLGGGGLLYDVGYDAGLQRFLSEPPDRQWLYEMARIAAAASAAGVPAMLYSVGVGPLTTEVARNVARFICQQAQAITVRDVASREALAECGVAKSRVHIAADPAMMVEGVAPRTGLPHGEPRPWIAVNVRPWGTETLRERVLAEGVKATRAVREQLGGTAVLLPMQRLYQDDLPLLEEVARGSGAAIVGDGMLPPTAVGLLGQCDVIVGMRLHALVLAVAAGKPFVAISYDQKVEEFAQRTGMGKYIHSADGFTAEAVIGSCREVLSQPNLGSALEAKREELREAAGVAAEAARELLAAHVRRRHPPTPLPVHVEGAPRPASSIQAVMRIRPDYRERPGGDTVQMEQTKRALEKLGVRVEISSAEYPDLSQCDVVHAFNLGRPEDPHRHCLEAVAAGKPVALSTVYWDFAEFWEWGDPDYWELPPPGQGVPVPRPAPLPDPIEARRRARLDQLRLAAIECATVYLPNGQGEAELLHRTCSMDLSRTVVVTNAVDGIFFAARPEPFVEKYGLRDFVLCAARVEKRKNQLLLVAALRGTGIPLVIVGQPNPEEYRDLCRKYADANVTFIEALTRGELASAYAAAKVHALPGWFETPGLSTLEAAAAGCNIVTTDRGTAREYLGDGAWYCDPKEVESIGSAVVAAYEAPRSGGLRELVRERYTWARAAGSTLEGYQLALALHARADDGERCERELRSLRAQTDYLAKLAGDRQYEAQQMRQWAKDMETELERLQGEFQRVTSRRLHRWSSAAARAGWSVLRAMGVRR
ncbi:MAG: polysaccharide pyruvyl transferase family protein [Armatimonadota bacterium]